MIAQGAHASMKAVIDQGRIQVVDGRRCLVIPLDDGLIGPWLDGNYAKIALSVDSEDELLELHAKALQAGIGCTLIQDSGLTEFGGVPTHTAIALGPETSAVLDTLTGQLKLL